MLKYNAKFECNYYHFKAKIIKYRLTSCGTAGELEEK